MAMPLGFDCGRKASHHRSRGFRLLWIPAGTSYMDVVSCILKHPHLSKVHTRTPECEVYNTHLSQVALNLHAAVMQSDYSASSMYKHVVWLVVLRLMPTGF